MKTTTRRVLMLLSAFFHGIVFLEFFMELPRSDIPPQWPAELSVLLGLSFLFSLSVIAVRAHRSRFFLLGGQLVILILIGIPEGRSLAIETILATLLVLECVLLNRLPWNVILGVLLVGVVTAIQTAHVTFVVPVAIPPTPSVITFGAILTTIFALAFVVDRVLEQLEKRQRLVERLDNTIVRLTDANVGFQHYASEVESESVNKERKRISGEIHDTIGYTITTLIMLMEAASDLADPAHVELRSLLKQGIDQAIGSLDEIRRSLHELRAMEAPRMHGLRAIKHMIRAFEDAAHMRVSVDFSNVDWNFDEDHNKVFYRMIQESLANAFRHGSATKVAVNFSQNDNELSMSIRDNGKGTVDIEEGIGLSGMRERIERLNGHFSARSVTDGFLVSATVPLNDSRGLHEH